MTQLAIKFVWRKDTKRAPAMAYGRTPSPWICKLEGETCKRRVYYDWLDYVVPKQSPKRYRQFYDVPMVVLVGDTKVPVTRNELAVGVCADRVHTREWRRYLRECRVTLAG